MTGITLSVPAASTADEPLGVVLPARPTRVDFEQLRNLVQHLEDILITRNPVHPESDYNRRPEVASPPPARVKPAAKPTETAPAKPVKRERRKSVQPVEKERRAGSKMGSTEHVQARQMYEEDEAPVSLIAERFDVSEQRIYQIKKADDDNGAPWIRSSKRTSTAVKPAPKTNQPGRQCDHCHIRTWRNPCEHCGRKAEASS